MAHDDDVPVPMREQRLYYTFPLHDRYDLGAHNKLWRSTRMDAMRALMLPPGILKKFEMANGEAAIAGLKVVLKLHQDPHPWDDLWRAIAAEHPFRDACWEDRNLLPLLDRVEVPVYLRCEWQNVPLHLSHTFTAYERLTNSKRVQVAMMGEHGLVTGGIPEAPDCWPDSRPPVGRNAPCCARSR
jgi:hypothetical protein